MIFEILYVRKGTTGLHILLVTLVSKVKIWGEKLGCSFLLERTVVFRGEFRACSHYLGSQALAFLTGTGQQQG